MSAIGFDISEQRGMGKYSLVGTRIEYDFSSGTSTGNDSQGILVGNIIGIASL